MRTKNGESAFPIVLAPNDYEDGMSLRQWYAGLAMQGLLANPNRVCEPGDCESFAIIAEDAFTIAYQMLVEQGLDT